jgi:hypothetical protein
MVLTAVSMSADFFAVGGGLLLPSVVWMDGARSR